MKGTAIARRESGEAHRGRNVGRGAASDIWRFLVSSWNIEKNMRCSKSCASTANGGCRWALFDHGFVG